MFWTWKVRHGQSGRPAVSKEIRQLIRKMSRDNPLWCAPKIHGELLKLGIDIGETSVSKYIVRRRRPPSQTWRSFLENHVKRIVSVDFFTVSTVSVWLPAVVVRPSTDVRARGAGMVSATPGSAVVVVLASVTCACPAV